MQPAAGAEQAGGAADAADKAGASGAGAAQGDARRGVARRQSSRRVWAKTSAKKPSKLVIDASRDDSMRIHAHGGGEDDGDASSSDDSVGHRGRFHLVSLPEKEKPPPQGAFFSSDSDDDDEDEAPGDAGADADADAEAEAEAEAGPDADSDAHPSFFSDDDYNGGNGGHSANANAGPNARDADGDATDGRVGAKQRRKSLRGASSGISSYSAAPDFRMGIFLTFRLSAVESKFRRYYFRTYYRAIRQAMIWGTLVWLLFLGNDIIKFKQGERAIVEVTAGVRVASFLIGCACIYLSYLPTRKFRRMMTSVVVFMLLTVGASQVSFGAIEDDSLDPTYSGMVVLIASMSATFFRLRFLPAAFVNWSLLVVYVVVTSAADTYEDNHSKLSLTVAVLVAGSVIFTVHAYFRELSIRKGFIITSKLELEEKRSNSILRRFLPGRIIKSLKSKQLVFERHREISILFSHIHDFDDIASQITASKLVTMLNRLFIGFDALIDHFHETRKSDIYKVETIGDVYMVASGLEDPHEQHAEVLCLLALRMQQVVQEIEFDELKSVQIRIGINSGPVFAGVIGTMYPRYRLIGDTVNVASRMSTTQCEPATTQISPSAYANVRASSGLVFRSRGQLPVKGKGTMKIYVLEGHERTNDDGGALQQQVHSPSATSPAHVQLPARNRGANAGDASPGVDNGGADALATVSSGSAAAAAAGGGGGGGDGAGGYSMQLPGQMPHCEDAHDRQAWVPPPSPSVAEVRDLLNVKLFGQNAMLGRDSFIMDLRRHHRAAQLGVPPGTARAVTVDARVSEDRASPLSSPPTSPRRYSLESGSLSSRTLSGVSSNKMAKKSSRHKHTQSTNMNIERDGQFLRRLSGDEGVSPMLRISDTTVEERSRTEFVSRLQALVSVQEGGDFPASPSSGHVRKEAATAAAGNIVVSDSAHLGDGGAVGPGNAGSGLGNDNGGGASSGGVSRSQQRHRSSSPIVYPPQMEIGHRDEGTPVQAMKIGALDDNEDDAHGSSYRELQRVISADEEDILGSQDPAMRVLTESRASFRMRSASIPLSSDMHRIDDLMNKRTLEFKKTPTLIKLETYFRNHYLKLTRGLNRLAIISVTLVVLLLGIYDSLNFGDDDLVTNWILRAVAVTCGLALYVYSRDPCRYTHSRMQVLTTMLLIVMSCLQVQIFILIEQHDEIYGVGVMLIILALTAVGFGLRFIYVITTNSVVLAYIVIADSIYTGTPDLVTLFLAAGAFLYTQSAYNAEYYARRDYIRLRKREDEKQRSGNLLESMLPIEVLEEIQQDTTVISHSFDHASVLFCDIVSFTSLADRMLPEDLVLMLNVVFSTYDRLSLKHNVYKVETIGDAYLACSGVVNRHPDDAYNIVNFALDLLESTVFETRDGEPIMVRVGIHTGRVIAGVVGFKMPRYHLFGDTYTVAEAYEQNGIPGKLIISESTFDAIERHRHYEIKQVEPFEHAAILRQRYIVYGPKDPYTPQHQPQHLEVQSPSAASSGRGLSPLSPKSPQQRRTASPRHRLQFDLPT